MMSKFLVSWDMYGIERCVQIDKFEQLDDEILMETIRTGEQQPDMFADLVNKMLLRARFNPHRCYEVYAFQTSVDMTEDEVVDMFNATPQRSADLIRTAGVKLYSSRINPNISIIT
jgi:hypothetical protein